MVFNLSKERAKSVLCQNNRLVKTKKVVKMFLQGGAPAHMNPLRPAPGM